VPRHWAIRNRLGHPQSQVSGAPTHGVQFMVKDPPLASKVLHARIDRQHD
jgi:hypothetical protein